jgi:hypothetical protein
MTLNLILISQILLAVSLGIIVILFLEIFFGLPFHINVTVFFALVIVAFVLAIVRILLKIKT